MSYVSHSMEILNGIVKKAGIGLVRDFTELCQLQSAPKGHEEFTAAAIERTSAILRNELNKFRPDYPIISNADDLPITECFVVNPLDGKVNFMHGIPYFAISVAVVKRTEILAAIVYNPATGDTYFADKGYGGFKEGQRNHLRTRVSSRKELSSCVVASDDNLKGQIGNLRNFGAVSLDFANVAAGQFDAVIAKGQNLADVAAGILLVKESGGRVFSFQQTEAFSEIIKQIWNEGNVIAGNPHITKKLFDLGV